MLFGAHAACGVHSGAGREQLPATATSVLRKVLIEIAAYSEVKTTIFILLHVERPLTVELFFFFLNRSEVHLGVLQSGLSLVQNSAMPPSFSPLQGKPSSPPFGSCALGGMSIF